MIALGLIVAFYIFGQGVTAVAAELTELKSIAGSELHTGPPADKLYDFNIVILEGGLWNAEVAKLHLKSAEAVFNKCGIGIGTVKLYSLPAPAKSFIDGGLSCTRFRTKKEPEYRCKPGPGDPATANSVQGIAQLTASLPRPTLHLIDNLESKPGIAMAYHTDKKVRKLWRNKKALTDPVTSAEKTHLDFFNNSLGTAFVGHNIDPSITQIGAANKIDDPELAVRMTHEMTHLLGIEHDHDTGSVKSFMNERPGYSTDVTDDLCKQMRASPVLRPAVPAGASRPSTLRDEPPGEAFH